MRAVEGGRVVWADTAFLGLSLIHIWHRLFFYSRSDRDDPSNRMEIDFLIVEPYENAADVYKRQIEKRMQK